MDDGVDLVFHTRLLADPLEHDTDGSDPDCPCGPKTDRVQRDDGTLVLLFRHKTSDGREPEPQ